YSYLGRRCMTSSECHKTRTIDSAENYLKNWWPFNRTCVNQCPPGYEEFNTGNTTMCQPCQGRCSHECRGAVVSSIEDAQRLRGCTTIINSLEIFIRGSGSHIVKELEENLSSIEEINGYLKVSRSFPLTSLNFLKNLRVIHGSVLDDRRYSLLVLENQNLQELWNWSSRPPLKIRNGSLKFHYNPKLCLSEIDKLQEIAGLQNYSNFDVSRESNGDKVACNVVILYANATVLSSKTVLIEWEPCLVPDPSSVLGYMVYYIEAPEQNVTEHDGLDACGDNGWRVVDFPYDTDENNATSSSGNLIRFLPHLEPYTQYAYYVKTYTKNNTGGQSKIKYFRTLPDRPSVPREIRAVSNSTSNIVVYWFRPKFPNGILSHYLVTGKWIQDDQAYLGQRNYCKHPLEHLPDPEVHKILSSTSESIGSHSCCEIIESEPPLLIENPDDYQKICLSGPVRSFKDERNPCNDYFYSFMHTSLLEILHTEDNPLSDRFPDQFSTSSEPQKLLLFNESIKNSEGIYEQIVERVDANTSFVVLNNLNHFAEYTINVFACREPHSTEPQNNNAESESQIDYQSFCSPAGIISVRTKPLPTADKIEYAHLAVVVSNTSRSVKLTWKEPRKPNGIILTYSIEHKRVDIDNFHPIVDCISRQEYMEYGGGFVLNSLAPGNYTFRVKVTSLAGEGHFTNAYSFHIEEPPVESNTGLVIGILLASVLILMGVAVSAMIWWRKKMKERSLMIIASVNPDYMSAGEAIYVEDEWEVSREKVKLLKELGQGSFGMVYEGLLKPEDTQCAIKMISESASVREKMEFLNEASMMKSFAGAHHVVNLLGVVSRGQPALVIMELMGKGDLKSYLRASREPPPPPPDLRRMLLMAAQIADGMAYLEAHKFVHRDLAARNCMIGDDLTVKIGDFGMTRDIYETDYYRNGSKGLLPVRWMSPESLADGVFTSQSDVWSFGVVLWEMTTLAEQPYQGLANEQVLQHVLGGGILERPLCCPEIFHQFMMNCWNRRPSRRPRFLNIVAELEAASGLDSKFKEVSFYHSKEGQELKANLDHQQELDLYNETTVDDANLKSPPVSFYQLVEEEVALIEQNPQNMNCPEMPQNNYLCSSKGSGFQSPGKSTQLQNIPDDSYVLPGSLMGPSGRYNFVQTPSETDCLLPESSQVQPKIPIHCAQKNSPKMINPPSRKTSVLHFEDGYVPAEDVYVRPDNVSVMENVCNENSEAQRLKVPLENESQSFAHVPKINISADSGLDIAGVNVSPSKSCVPVVSDDIPKQSPSIASHSDNSGHGGEKDTTYRPPNGMVNGFISVPQNQNDSEFVPIFK
ncbi:hypothetical protein L9F63_014407, partial [Diploptera punctata]